MYKPPTVPDQLDLVEGMDCSRHLVWERATRTGPESESEGQSDMTGWTYGSLQAGAVFS